MNFKNLALVSTSLVALGFSVTTSHAVATMGRVDLGFTEWFDNYDYRYGGQGSSYDYDWPSVTGMARVNIPYNDRTNVQLDFFGDGSLDGNHNSGGEGYSNGIGNVGLGAHINWRDSSQGLLGVFAAAGRVWDFYYSAPAVMAGLEGQYYCGHWAGYAQLGYMDSDGRYYFLQNAGFARALISYYATPKLKITAGGAYMDGENSYGDNASAWAWQAGGEYWFGKSVPVVVGLKYQGRDAEVHYGPYKSDLQSNEVTLSVSFMFGGDSIEDADKNGTSTEIANFDWFRLPVFVFARVVSRINTQSLKCIAATSSVVVPDA